MNLFFVLCCIFHQEGADSLCSVRLTSAQSPVSRNPRPYFPTADSAVAGHALPTAFSLLPPPLLAFPHHELYFPRVFAEQHLPPAPERFSLSRCTFLRFLLSVLSPPLLEGVLFTPRLDLDAMSPLLEYFPFSPLETQQRPRETYEEM